ncbi:MAG: hypothetical protein HOP19_23260 [Acidobacteria bacterium]|nr:hypothetical protein [Acidobacteriota bacterium]
MSETISQRPSFPLRNVSVNLPSDAKQIEHALVVGIGRGLLRSLRRLLFGHELALLPLGEKRDGCQC